MSPNRFTSQMDIRQKAEILGGGDTELTEACVQLGQLFTDEDAHHAYNLLDQLDLRGAILSHLLAATCEGDVRNLAMLIFAYRNQIAGIDMRSLIRAAHDQGSIDMNEVLRQIAALGDDQQ